VYYCFIKKEKKTYEHLNMMQSNKAGSLLFGYFWCPLKVLELKDNIANKKQNTENSDMIEG
jgi:hypothetical protein